MSVNDKQVGGAHYGPGKEIQHWDIMINWGIPYTVACASKYLWRWKKKNGLQDLQKSLHYIEKTIESWSKIGYRMTDIPKHTIDIVAKEEGWDEYTHSAIYWLLNVGTLEGMHNAHIRVSKLISEQESEAPPAGTLHPA